MRILLPAVLLLIAFWVYSIVDCALLAPTRHRGMSKPVWLLLVLLSWSYFIYQISNVVGVFLSFGTVSSITVVHEAVSYTHLTLPTKRIV